MHPSDMSLDSARTINVPDETCMLILGVTLAKCLKAGDCLGFYGTLGAGKTTLARGLIKAVMGEECHVPSPTFTLVQAYEPLGHGTPLWHFDLYRLKQADEIIELGWDTALEDIALVEWPERAGRYFPRWALGLRIDFAPDDGRSITFLGDSWTEDRFSPLFT